LSVLNMISGNGKNHRIQLPVSDRRETVSFDTPTSPQVPWNMTFALTPCCRLGDVPHLTADPSLAQRELGFIAQRDLETMCRDLWNFQSLNATGWGDQ
jgi:UDP-glucose 4-epimerase